MRILLSSKPKLKLKKFFTFLNMNRKLDTISLGDTTLLFLELCQSFYMAQKMHQSDFVQVDE